MESCLGLFFFDFRLTLFLLLLLFRVLLDADVVSDDDVIVLWVICTWAIQLHEYKVNTKISLKQFNLYSNSKRFLLIYEITVVQ